MLYWLLELLYTAFTLNTTINKTEFAQNCCKSYQEASTLWTRISKTMYCILGFFRYLKIFTDLGPPLVYTKVPTKVSLKIGGCLRNTEFTSVQKI